MVNELPESAAVSTKDKAHQSHEGADEHEFDASLGAKLLTDPASSLRARETGKHANGADAKQQSPQERALAEYKLAQDNYKQQLKDYWAGVDISKVQHRQVHEFPPLYDGPKNPDNSKRPETPRTLSTVNDMLVQSKNLNRVAAGDVHQPDFKVRQASEEEFKRSYAREALHLGKELHVSPKDMKNLLMSIYAFEGAGKATYDTLSGVPLALTKPDDPGKSDNLDKRRNIHPVSTAIGYNQIIMHTNLTFVDRESKEIAGRLRELGKGSTRPQEFEAKAKLYEKMHDVLHRELMVMANKNDASRAKYLENGQPNGLLYQDFAKSTEAMSLKSSSGHQMTRQELSRGLQALNLDGDIGPIVQGRQLRRLTEHFSTDAMKSTLAQKADALKSEAESYDKLVPAEKHKAIDELLKRAGLDKDAAMNKKIFDYADNCGQLNDQDWSKVTNRLFTLRRTNDERGPLSQNAVKLLGKLEYTHYGQPTGADFLAAAAELGNLSGNHADNMLNPRNAKLPTPNFFDRAGYESNPLVQRKTADELFHTVFINMHGAGASSSNWGNAEFEKAFKSLP